jgi:hypothetical protein
VQQRKGQLEGTAQLPKRGIALLPSA